MLPNVRILKFDLIAFFILELCRMFPHLEHLVLNNVSTIAVTMMHTPTEHMHSSLEILDLRCYVYLSARLGLPPSAKAPQLLVELAPQLRTCAVPIYAAEYSGECSRVRQRN